MNVIQEKYLETSFCLDKWPDEEHLRLIDFNYAELLPQDKSARLLEIGAGLGDWLVYGKRKGYTNIKAIDISPSVVRFCTSRHLECELVEDTSSWLRQRTNTFDFINLSHVLEHIPKPELELFLTGVYNSLAVDGLLVITVPNMQAPDSNLYRYDDVTHETGFTERSLLQPLLVVGFSNVTFQEYENIYIHRSARLFRQMPVRGFKHLVSVPIRKAYRTWIRATRTLNGNMSPRILSPCLIAVAQRVNANSSTHPTPSIR